MTTSIEPLFDSRAVTIHDPTTLPASFLGLEVLVVGGAVLTLWHAVRAHRRGDPAALLTWVTILLYGLVMEVLSYNFIENFVHGQFTVMFYDRQLPLYVTAVYPVLLYGGIATARSLGLPARIEPIAAGVLIMAMDVPFDVVGPAAGWWSWSDVDPKLAVRWLGVPVTSYFWHFAFGAVLAALTAAAGRRRKGLGWSVPLALATIVLGVVAFLPFHGLVALGVDDGVVVAIALITGAALAVGAPRTSGLALDPVLTGLWLAFYGYHLLLAGGGVRLAFIAAVAVVALAIQLAGLIRRPPLGARPA